jgi:hypothetical protein
LHFTTFYWMSGMEILARCFLRGGVRVFSGDVDGETILKIVQEYKVTQIKIDGSFDDLCNSC